MHRYILRRLLLMIPVLLGVTFVVFCLLELTPGDPAEMILSDGTEEEIEALREEMGLNRPFLIRFFDYLWGALHGDLGNGYFSKQPVMDDLMSHYPTTLLFASLCIIGSALIGIPLGIISAKFPYTIFDNAAMAIALLGVSIPGFWLGMLLMLTFAVQLGWFPVSGFYGPAYWVLPAVAVAFHSAAMIARMTRSSLLEVTRQDYIRTARAKGQSEWKITFKHELRNAFMPVLTTLGLQFVHALGGAVVIEQIFAIPGIGNLIVQSIKRRDYPIVLGGVLLVAVFCSLVNLVIDLLYAFIDPRVKSRYSKGAVKKVKAKGGTSHA